MYLSFTTATDHQPGTIAALLRRSYVEMMADDPLLWEPEQAEWEEYDQAVLSRPDTVGACIFLTQLNDLVTGFGSWDPRQGPRLGVLGHNCILPEHRGRGYGRQQMHEILRRLADGGFRVARAVTNDHRFFTSTRRMYLSCGFREVGRRPWERDPSQMLIEYEKKIG